MADKGVRGVIYYRYRNTVSPHLSFPSSLSSICLLNARPVKGLHLQFLANVDTKMDADAVAEEHVHEDDVPPTLSEVRQHVHERHL